MTSQVFFSIYMQCETQMTKPSNLIIVIFEILTKHLFAGPRSSLNTGLFIGLVSGCVVLVIGLVGMWVYARKQRENAQRALEVINPFGNEVVNSHNSLNANLYLVSLDCVLQVFVC